jgi:glycosyltransferase involved in cell wall biosynthesis
MSNLLVIIPALNEAGGIGEVVTKVRRAFDADVVVIDDGSTDRTGEVSRESGALVIRHPFNLGLGAAIRTGLRYAADEQYEVVLKLDGDGQHDPEEGKKLLSCLETEDVDMVVGSRFALGYSVSKQRRLIMRFLAWIVSRHTKTKITDTTSGFRAFGPRSISFFQYAYPSDFLFEAVESFLLAGDVGLKVAEVPVQMKERAWGTPSAGPFGATLYLFRLLLIILLHRIRKPLSTSNFH